MAQLSPGSQDDCQASGFDAAPAPTDAYAFDVHIDNGLVTVASAALLQDYLIAPLWMGLVWLMHAVIVALEWGYTIDLLQSAAMRDVTAALGDVQATVTQPLMKIVFAIASIVVIYQGFLRRRVAETLGHVLLMLVMIVGGMWIALDPIGTVGAVGRYANQMSVGTLAAVVSGRPARPSAALADGLGEMYAGAIGAPWCYMEFGNVTWCDDPARRDPALRAAALRIAQHLRSGASCGSSVEGKPCEQSSARSQPARSGRLLEEAKTNGAMFLALPANQSDRNAINDSGSLLRVLCGGATATACPSATAGEAEFRTQGGTDPRLEGLVLITIGLTGLLMLLGFIAMHLLGSALTSLLYLMLAPFAVLAPAFGDRGRTAFRSWITRLLGALVNKLLYSLLLGVVLLLTRVLIELHSLGWWVQWLLLSTLWWGAFRHRHQIPGLERSEGQSRAFGAPRHAAGPIAIARELIRRSPRRRGALRSVLRRPIPESPGLDGLGWTTPASDVNDEQ